MKKFLKVVCLVLVAFLCVGFCPTFSHAEEGEIIYDLVPANFNEDVSQTKTKYNISRVSNYTPLDRTTGKRMRGMSFFLNEEEKLNQILDKEVFTDEVELGAGDYSLRFWIYFSGALTHNLSIRLVCDDGSSFGWNLSQQTFFDLVKKNPEDDVSFSSPLNWNLMEFAFSGASDYGSAVVGKKIKKIVVNYSTPNANDKFRFSSVQFYQFQVVKNSDNRRDGVQCVQKQNYIESKFKLLDEQQRSAIVGDSIKLPRFSEAVEYAWRESDDLTLNGTFSGSSGTGNKYSWKLVVISPDETEKQYYGGETLTFGSEGTYTISYQCYSEGTCFLWKNQTIEVKKIIPIFIIGNPNIVVGTTYSIDVGTSSAFKEIESVHFSCDSKNIELNYANSKLQVRVLKEGSYTVTAKVRANRENDPEFREYTNSFTIKAVDNSERQDPFVKIFLWSVLAIFGTGLIIYVIILVVKTRKKDVK